MITKNQQTVRIGILVFLLTICSKVFAFLREIVYSGIFGTSIFSDAYFASNIIPGLLYTPLIMSMLVFFIPLYNKIGAKGTKYDIDKFSSNILNIFVIISSLLMLFVLIFAKMLIRLVAPGFSGEVLDYGIRLLRISSISFPITMITWIYINISNANQKHLIPQFLSVINSLVAILAMLILSNTIGIYIVPIAGLVAWIVQMYLQKISIRKIYKYHFIIDFKDTTLRQILFLALPVLIATGVEQINVSIDNVICSLFNSGSISSLSYAQKVLNLINGTFTTTIITIMYPIFSSLHANHKIEEFYNKLKQCIRILLLCLIPTTIICILGSKDIIRIIYYRGAFTIDDVYTVSNIFIYYSVGILFLALKEIYTRVFYIYGDSKTPAIINILCIAINIFLNILLSRFMGIPGLSLATSLSYIITYIFQKVYLEKKYLVIKKYNNKKILFQIFAASIALVVSWVLLQILMRTYSTIFKFVISSIIGISIYMFVLLAFRNDECLYAFKTVVSFFYKKIKKFRGE